MISTITKVIDFIESNIEQDLTIDDVCEYSCYSSAHFQRIFTLITGITIGEYIRNRRLSLAGVDLLKPENKVTYIAFKYQYETVESFSKAFRRFHGINPSEVKTKGNELNYFYPLKIILSIEGGYEMKKRIDDFCWTDFTSRLTSKQDDEKKYEVITKWALNARSQNPVVFDTLTEWLTDDSEWDTDQKVRENESIFINGVISRFKIQNTKLRTYIKEIKDETIVNKAVFKAIDRFDDELNGLCDDKAIASAVNKMYVDFMLMKDKEIRKLIAGEKTGPTGTDNVNVFGYINRLKECDAQVQWSLFMPETVKRQQKGFKVESFEYLSFPKLCFVGFEGEEYIDEKKRKDKMKELDKLHDHKCGFDYDILFMHHYGKNVDVGKWHGVWGRFFDSTVVVPEGFLSFDFIEEFDDQVGPPYISKFAYACFSGSIEAMHSREGYDSIAMYDVTRNIILAQGECIPYPTKYWTAEVFINGCTNPSTAFLFSAIKNK